MDVKKNEKEQKWKRWSIVWLNQFFLHSGTQYIIKTGFQYFLWMLSHDFITSGRYFNFSTLFFIYNVCSSEKTLGEGWKDTWVGIHRANFADSILDLWICYSQSCLLYWIIYRLYTDNIDLWNLHYFVISILFGCLEKCKKALKLDL
jgi:hypothetical protein